MPVDPVFRLELIEQGLVVDQHLLAGRDALIGHDAVDIFADRLHIFGLEIGGLDHRGVRREALKGDIERSAGDPGSLGGRP